MTVDCATTCKDTKEMLKEKLEYVISQYRSWDPIEETLHNMTVDPDHSVIRFVDIPKHMSGLVLPDSYSKDQDETYKFAVVLLEYGLVMIPKIIYVSHYGVKKILDTDFAIISNKAIDISWPIPMKK